jgi:DUF4097 and DUF4098 domain-containing protein YvlB
MTVTAGTGNAVVVDVTARGRDAARLQVESGRIDGRETLRIRAPGSRLLYPEMGRGSSTNIQVARDGTFGDGVRGSSITIAGSGSGAEAWAELAVRVPPGRTLRLHTAVGSVDVSNTQGTLHVHTASARVRIADVQGPLDARASSGRLEISGVQGAVTARASSGSITAENLRNGSHSLHTSSGTIRLRGASGGALELRASSGSIDASGITATTVSARTSSGSVSLNEASGDRLTAQTSSGRIRAGQVAVAEIELQTSSGSIEVNAVTPPRTASLTASSGSVRASLPADFAGNVDIRTSSGSINSEMPVLTTSAARNQLVGTIGQGTSTLHVRTASGSVRLTRS